MVLTFRFVFAWGEYLTTFKDSLGLPHIIAEFCTRNDCTAELIETRYA